MSAASDGPRRRGHRLGPVPVELGRWQPQPPGPHRVPSLLVDCDACAARGPACDDCVVSVLLGPLDVPLDAPGGTGLALDADEVAAIDALAGSGLVPPLRLVPPDPPPARSDRPRGGPPGARRGAQPGGP